VLPTLLSFLAIDLITFLMYSPFYKDNKKDAKRKSSMSTELSQVSSSSSSSGGTHLTVAPLPPSISQVGITGSHIIDSTVTINQTIVYQYPYYDKIEKSTGKVTQGLPFLSQHFIGQQKYIEQIEAQLKKPLPTNQSIIIIAIHGLKGIGKTYLATYIVHHLSQIYNFRAWFDATTPEHLATQYIALGEALKIFPADSLEKDDLDKKAPISPAEKINLVKQLLENNPGWLLVYDNAGSLDQLQPYLPNKGGRILVTSTNPKWDEPRIKIDVMREEDAIELVRKISGRTDQEQDIKTLVNPPFLGRLPLALAQAGAYINASEITVSKYIELYETQKKQLLADQEMPSGDSHDPVYVTWNVSLDAITKKSKFAKEILILCSYLYFNNIPRLLLAELLKNMGSTDANVETDLNKVISVLRSYSLIQADEKFVSMHCVLQDVIKEKQKIAKPTIVSNEKSFKESSAGKSDGSQINSSFSGQAQDSPNDIEEIFENLAQVLIGVYPHDKLSSKDYEYCKILIPHLKSVVANYANHITLQQVGKKVYRCRDFFLLLLVILAKAFGSSDNIREQKNYLLMIFQFTCTAFRNNPKALLQLYDHNIYSPLPFLYKLGKVHFKLGEFKEALDVLGEALSIYERKFTRKHITVAKTLDILGLVYSKMGDSCTAIKLFKESLAIKEEVADKNSGAIASTLFSLGGFYVNSGNMQEGITLLNRALQITEEDIKKNSRYKKNAAEILTALGIAHYNSENFSEAEKFLTRALDMMECFYGREQIRLVTVLKTLSDTYEALGDSNCEKMPEVLERALRIEKSFYGEDHIVVADTSKKLGFVYTNLMKFQKAKELLELVIKGHFYDKDQDEMAKIRLCLGAARAHFNLIDQAKEDFEFAYDVFQKNHGDDYDYTKMAKCNLELLSQNQQKLAKDLQKNSNILASASLEPNKSETLGLPHSIFSLTIGDTNMTMSKKDYFVTSLASELKSMFARACTELKFEQFAEDLIKLRKEKIIQDNKVAAEIIGGAGKMAAAVSGSVLGEIDLPSKGSSSEDDKKTLAIKPEGIIVGVGELILGIINAVRNETTYNMEKNLIQQRFGNIRLIDLLARYAERHIKETKTIKESGDIRNIVEDVSNNFANEVSKRLYCRHADLIDKLLNDDIFKLQIFFRTAIRTGIFCELNIGGDPLNRALRAALPIKESALFEESGFKKALEEAFPNKEDHPNIFKKPLETKLLDKPLVSILHDAPCLVVDQNQIILLEDSQSSTIPYVIMHQAELANGSLPYTFTANKNGSPRIVGYLVTKDTETSVLKIIADVQKLKQSITKQNAQEIQNQIQLKMKNMEVLIDKSINGTTFLFTDSKFNSSSLKQNIEAFRENVSLQQTEVTDSAAAKTLDNHANDHLKNGNKSSDDTKLEGVNKVDTKNTDSVSASSKPGTNNKDNESTQTAISSSSSSGSTTQSGSYTAEVIGEGAKLPAEAAVYAFQAAATRSLDMEKMWKDNPELAERIEKIDNEKLKIMLQNTTIKQVVIAKGAEVSPGAKIAAIQVLIHSGSIPTVPDGFFATRGTQATTLGTTQPTSSVATPTSSSSSSNSSSTSSSISFPTASPTTDVSPTSQALPELNEKAKEAIIEEAKLIANDAAGKFMSEQKIERKKTQRAHRESVETQISQSLSARAIAKSFELNKLQSAEKEELAKDISKAIAKDVDAADLLEEKNTPCIEISTIPKIFDKWLEARLEKAKQAQPPVPQSGISNTH
jgi:tetratricopeptide (TPR) repeat protein